MRVALYVHCYYPTHFYGTESYARTLARELSALGHEPVVVTATFPGEPRQDAFVERGSFDGIPVIRIDRNVVPNRTLRDTYDLPDLRFVHERILRDVRPDIVHVCHLINHTTALLEVTRGLGLPAVATFTDFFGFCFNNKLSGADGALCAGPDRLRANCIACALPSGPPAGEGAAARLKRALAPGLLARAPGLSAEARPMVEALKARPDHLRAAYGAYAAALAPTRFLRDAYARAGTPVPMELSRFGIDIDRAEKPERSDGVTRLGFIGQLAPHKGTHLLVEALRRLQAPALELEIFGDEGQDPAYAARLRAMAEGLPVRFRGTFPVERIAAVLAGIDVLAIPSTWVENSPLILLQALATHTPVVVADVEGMSEFVEEGENGFRFPAGSVDGLTAALRRFVDDPALARELGARTRYARTCRAMAEDVVALYGRVRATGEQDGG
ncbi:glycosyltransferase family 4 protein [Xanthobacter sp. V2C-8]|uniref:glycosyltransferase family 4 protein n=1 Tax=Xanthobacter albus TaxID=3119929 RepID=UPI0037294D98